MFLPIFEDMNNAQPTTAAPTLSHSDELPAFQPNTLEEYAPMGTSAPCLYVRWLDREEPHTTLGFDKSDRTGNSVSRPCQDSHGGNAILIPPTYKQTAPLRAGLSILEREGLHNRRRAEGANDQLHEGARQDWQGGTPPRPHQPQGTGQGGDGQPLQLHQV